MIPEALWTGVGYHEEQLHAELRLDDGSKQQVPVSGKLLMATDGVRHCIGARPPGASSLQPCPDNMTNVSGTQCDRCFTSSVILPCLRCNGERCANPARRNDCVQPENHAVYLAAFANGVLKVGVARWGRRWERLREQGARQALIVARDDGQLARRTEKQIQKCGIPDRLSFSERLTCLSDEPQPEVLWSQLERALEGVQRRVMRAKWLEEPERMVLPSLPVVPYHPQTWHIHGDTKMRDTITGVAGQILLTRSENDVLKAFDCGQLVGYRWRPIEDDEIVEEQMQMSLI